MKTALITGGAKRIGASIARDLASDGFDIALQYASSQEEADSLASELGAMGRKTLSVHADLTTPGAAKALFGKARDALGTVDLVVNNASAFEHDEPADAEAGAWDRHFDIHLRAPSVLTAELAGQGELENGLVINMIDQRVWNPNPKFYSYTLSKFALWTATQTLAQTYAPRVRVNAIGPGPTLRNARQSEDDFQAQIDGLILKRGPELEEFGRTVRYFYETRSVTGQMIALDGGQHLAWETPDVAGINE